VDSVQNGVVRPRPRITDKSRIEYQIDEFVEVFTRNQKWEAEGWWKAVIKNKKASFFYVAYENSDKYDEIVEKNRLRPINTREPLNAKDYTQVQIPVPLEVLGWAQNIEESDEKLDGIRLKSNNLIVSFDTDRKHVIVLGKEKNIETAKLLIDIVLSHQAEVLQHDLMSREGIESFTESVVIESIVWSYLKGLKNKYFEGIKEKYNVELDVVALEDDNLKVIITGDKLKAVKSAKKEMDLKLTEIILTERQLNYIKTKVIDLQQKSKVVAAFKDEEGTKIIVIGTEDALKNFKLAVETWLGLESNLSELASENKERSEVTPTYTENYGYYGGNRGSRGRPYRGKKNFSGIRYVRR